MNINSCGMSRISGLFANFLDEEEEEERIKWKYSDYVKGFDRERNSYLRKMIVNPALCLLSKPYCMFTNGSERDVYRNIFRRLQCNGAKMWTLFHWHAMVL